jgi:hypothetical protein
MIDGSGPLTDPDGPKTYGSGSATLLRRLPEPFFQKLRKATRRGYLEGLSEFVPKVFHRSSNSDPDSLIPDQDPGPAF